MSRWAASGRATAALVILAGCRGGGDAPAPTPERAPVASSAAPTASDKAPADGAADEALARKAMQRYGQRLREELTSAMQRGGPVAAVDVCHTAAPAVAEEVERELGVRVGRVAVLDRERNPLQRAQGWQGDVLATLRAPEDGGAAEPVTLRESLPGDVALRMVRAIPTEAPCLACHGQDVQPAVRAAIARHYPNDRATGFALGELRGALWVEVPKRQ